MSILVGLCCALVCSMPAHKFVVTLYAVYIPTYTYMVQWQSSTCTCMCVYVQMVCYVKRVFVYIHTYSWNLCVYTNMYIYTVGVCVYTVTMSSLCVHTCQLTQVSVQISLIPMQPLILGMRLMFTIFWYVQWGSPALYPGSWWAKRKIPGIYCSHMHVIIPWWIRG